MLTLNTSPDRKYSVEYTFASGEHKGERYRGNISACDNPICQCESIALLLETAAAHAAAEKNSKNAA